MSTVGAFIEIPPGHTEPNWFDWENHHSGNLRDKGSWGLNVSWLGDITPPEGAQVYLVWEPRIVAVWSNEEEIEDGEDREDADGSNTEQRDEEVPAEPDLGTGEGGAEPGDSQSFGAEGGDEEVE